jgi:spore germination protein
MRRGSVARFLGASALASAAITFAWGQGRQPPPPQLQAWIAYFRASEGLKDLDLVRETLDDVSVFALHFDGQGRVVPATPWVKDTLAKLASSPARPERLWLTVVNDVHDGQQNLLKDPAMAHEKLATPQARTRHVQELLDQVGPADGLDVDYEGLKKEDGEAYSLFIEELARRLHAGGKKLSVTVEPKLTPIPGNGGKAIDWRRIGAAADQVRVMSYFYHYPNGKPGPIAPLKWLSDLSRFARQAIPPEKLVIVLTVNGLDWPAGGKARGVRFSDVTLLLADHGLKPRRDSASQAPYLRYTKEGQRHEVWYEDAISLQAKIQRLRHEGIRTIGFWQLGSGDPDFWKGLGRISTAETTRLKELRSSAKSDPPAPPSPRN